VKRLAVTAQARLGSQRDVIPGCACWRSRDVNGATMLRATVVIGGLVLDAPTCREHYEEWALVLASAGITVTEVGMGREVLT
jgi:hypothetical protein